MYHGVASSRDWIRTIALQVGILLLAGAFVGLAVLLWPALAGILASEHGLLILNLFMLGALLVALAGVFISGVGDLRQRAAAAGEPTPRLMRTLPGALLQFVVGIAVAVTTVPWVLGHWFAIVALLPAWAGLGGGLALYAVAVWLGRRYMRGRARPVRLTRRDRVVGIGLFLLMLAAWPLAYLNGAALLSAFAGPSAVTVAAVVLLFAPALIARRFR